MISIVSVVIYNRYHDQTLENSTRFSLISRLSDTDMAAVSERISLRLNVSDYPPFLTSVTEFVPIVPTDPSDAIVHPVIVLGDSDAAFMNRTEIFAPEDPYFIYEYKDVKLTGYGLVFDNITGYWPTTARKYKGPLVFDKTSGIIPSPSVVYLDSRADMTVKDFFFYIGPATVLLPPYFLTESRIALYGSSLEPNALRRVRHWEGNPPLTIRNNIVKSSKVFKISRSISKFSPSAFRVFMDNYLHTSRSNLYPKFKDEILVCYQSGGKQIGNVRPMMESLYKKFPAEDYKWSIIELHEKINDDLAELRAARIIITIDGPLTINTILMRTNTTVVEYQTGPKIDTFLGNALSSLGIHYVTGRSNKTADVDDSHGTEVTIDTDLMTELVERGMKFYSEHVSAESST